MLVKDISVTVKRPVGEVFEFAADPEKLPQWADEIQDAWITCQDNPGAGTTYNVKAAVMGRIEEFRSEIVAYEKDRVFAYHTGGNNFYYTSTKVFVQTPEGTRISETIEGDLQSFFMRILSPLVASYTKRSHTKNLENLKTVLENGVDQAALNDAD
jgi:uncharacterized protein YndB with AHSA1/START domain